MRPDTNDYELEAAAAMLLLCEWLLSKESFWIYPTLSPRGKLLIAHFLKYVFHEKARQKYFVLVVLMVGIKTKKKIPFTPTYSFAKIIFKAHQGQTIRL